LGVVVAFLPPPPAAPPPPAPAHRRWPLAVLGVGVLLAIGGVIALIAGTSGGGKKATTTPKRPSGPPPIAYTSTGRIGGLTYRANSVRTLKVLNRGELTATSGGRFVLVDVRVANDSDRTLPQRVDAFRLRGGRGAIYKPVLGLSQFTLAIRPKRRESLLLPFDVSRDQVRNSRLLVDKTTASGRQRKLALVMDLGLDDGLGDLVAGRWTGTTSQGKPFNMVVEKGDVITSVSFGTSKGCTAQVRGAAFVENGRFKETRGPQVQGSFASSVEAAGSAQAAAGARCGFGSITWRATRRGGG